MKNNNRNNPLTKSGNTLIYGVKTSESKSQYFVMENKKIYSIHYTRAAAVSEMMELQHYQDDFIIVKKG